MRYVDGFVVPIPKKNLQSYCRIARKAGKIWREHGALEYRECVGDDLKTKGLVSFPRLAKMIGPKAMPFDVKRMAYGGFKVLVEL